MSPITGSAASDHQEAHWDGVYHAKPTESLSWFQKRPSLSLELIAAVAPERGTRIIDVGGGDSLLVDNLLEAGYRQVTVLDLSASAIERAQARLGSKAEKVRWIVGDVLAEDARGIYDVWHDRALFHFLVDPMQRHQYVAAIMRMVVAKGAVIIATFATDGPEHCSGLQVRRYDEGSLAAELGDSFKAHETRRELHHTPSGAEQSFVYVTFRRVSTTPR